MINFNLLDQKNSIRLGEITAGELLQQKSLKHLWDERPCPVDTVVIHAMSAIEVTPDAPYDLQELLKIFISYEVSSHFLILRDGTTHQLVPTEKRAWHAGPSQMPAPDNRESVNDFSIGIELAGTVNSGYTNEQYRALQNLVMYLEEKHNIKNYVGHDSIAGERVVAKKMRAIAKWDPGRYFQWNRIATIASKRVFETK